MIESYAMSNGLQNLREDDNSGCTRGRRCLGSLTSFLAIVLSAWFALEVTVDMYLPVFDQHSDQDAWREQSRIPYRAHIALVIISINSGSIQIDRHHRNMFLVVAYWLDLPQLSD